MEGRLLRSDSVAAFTTIGFTIAGRKAGKMGHYITATASSGGATGGPPRIYKAFSPPMPISEASLSTVTETRSCRDQRPNESQSGDSGRGLIPVALIPANTFTIQRLYRLIGRK